MPKSNSARYLCIALLFAISISVSPDLPAQAQGGSSGYSVGFWYQPMKFLCIGESAPININYQAGQGIDDRYKHLPLAGGLLTTQAMLGTVTKPKAQVSRVPGLVDMTYKAEKFGTEMLRATLSSNGKTLAIGNARQFNVRKCEYELSINASDSVKYDSGKAKVTITVWFKAKGNISIEGTNIMGEIPTSLGYSVQSDSDDIECNVVPEVKAGSNMTIEGTKSEGIFGAEILQLTFDYTAFQRIPQANIVCKDKIGQKKIDEFPFPGRSKYTPATDLETSVEISGWQSVTRDYGKGGKVTYSVKKINPGDK